MVGPASCPERDMDEVENGEGSKSTELVRLCRTLETKSSTPWIQPFPIVTANKNLQVLQQLETNLKTGSCIKFSVQFAVLSASHSFETALQPLIREFSAWVRAIASNEKERVSLFLAAAICSFDAQVSQCM